MVDVSSVATLPYWSSEVKVMGTTAPAVTVAGMPLMTRWWVVPGTTG